MFYSIEGTLSQKTERFIVVENQGIGYQIFISRETLDKLAPTGQKVRLFLHHHLREDASDLYGFLTKAEADLFEMLLSVGGIGPKSALGVLGLSSVENLEAAIINGKTEFLNRAPGIGRKTSERIILELKSKLVSGEKGLLNMEGELELEEALVSLGYDKQSARKAIKSINPETISFNDRLKEVLKILGKK
jgi:Holliday junction DNA helicase RuvA